MYYCTTLIQLAINIIFFFEYLPEDGQKKAETCRRFTTCLHIIVSTYSAAVGVCVCVCVCLVMGIEIRGKPLPRDGNSLFQLLYYRWKIMEKLLLTSYLSLSLSLSHARARTHTHILQTELLPIQSISHLISS